MAPRLWFTDCVLCVCVCVASMALGLSFTMHKDTLRQWGMWSRPHWCNNPRRHRCDQGPGGCCEA